MRYLRLPHLHPDRADLAEFLNDPGERAHHLVEVLLRRGAAERKPERRMGVFVWLSEREDIAMPFASRYKITASPSTSRIETLTLFGNRSVVWPFKTVFGISAVSR